MTPTDAERDMVVAAVAARREERDFARRLRRERHAERHRLAQADRSEHERLIHGVLTASGVDRTDVQRRRENSTAHARAFLEQQRRTIADHSAAAAGRHEALARRRGEGLAAQRRARADAYALTTVDTAAAIWPVHAPPDTNNQVTVHFDPPAPNHNVAKVYQSTQASPDIGFHVPGIWIVEIHWLFRFDATDNVLLNAVTFVQASGADSLFASGWLFGGSYAQIDFATSLDLFVVGPPPPQQIQPLGVGDHDTGPQRRVSADWWDFTGQFDAAGYDFQSTLIDNGFSPVAADSTVFFVVSAELDLSADGNAFCVADFLTADLQINVPAVYVSTFPDNPIP